MHSHTHVRTSAPHLSHFHAPMFHACLLWTGHTSSLSVAQPPPHPTSLIHMRGRVRRSVRCSTKGWAASAWVRMFVLACRTCTCLLRCGSCCCCGGRLPSAGKRCAAACWSFAVFWLAFLPSVCSCPLLSIRLCALCAFPFLCSVGRAVRIQSTITGR